MANGDDKTTKTPTEQTKDGSSDESTNQGTSGEQATRQEAKQQVASEYDAYDASDLIIEDGQVKPKQEAVARERQETKQTFAQRFEQQFTASRAERANDQLTEAARSGNITPETFGDITETFVSGRRGLNVDLGSEDVTLVQTEEGTSARLSEQGQQDVKKATQRTLAEQLSQQTPADFSIADVTPSGELTSTGKVKLRTGFAEATPGVDPSGVGIKQTDSGFQTTLTEQGQEQFKEFVAGEVEGVSERGVRVEKQDGQYLPTLTGIGEMQLEAKAAEDLEARIEGRGKAQEDFEAALEQGLSRDKAAALARQNKTTGGLPVDLGPGDIDLVQTGDGAQFELSSSGQNEIEGARQERVAKQFDEQVPIDIGTGDIAVQSEIPNSRIPTSDEGVGRRYTLDQEAKQRLEDYQREQAQTQIEQSLEEKTGADLQDEDVTVSQTTNEKGETVFQGGLSDEGQQEVGGQSVPGSDLPVVGGVLEGGGEFAVEVDQKVFNPTRQTIEGAFDYAAGGIGSAMPDVNLPEVPEIDLPEIGDGDDGVTDKAGLTALAAGAVATPEPVSTGAGALVLGGIGVATVTAGALKSPYFEGPPTANAAYQGGEIGIPQQRGRQGELPVSDPTQSQSELAIGGGDAVTATEIGLPTEGVFDSELTPTDQQQGGEIPVGTGTGESPILADLSAVVGSGTVGEDTGPQTPTTPGEDTITPDEPTVEQPDPTEVDETDPTRQEQRRDFDTGGDSVVDEGTIRERTFERDRGTVERSEVDFGEIDRSVFNQNRSSIEANFGDVTKPFYERGRGEISEGTETGPTVRPDPRGLDVEVGSAAIARAEQAQSTSFGEVGADPFQSTRSNPRVRPETSPLQDVDAAVDSLAKADTRTQAPVEDVALGNQQARPIQDGFEFEQTQPERNAEVNQYEYQYEFNTRIRRKKKLRLPDLESDTGDDKKRRGDADSGVFDNPAIDPTSAFTFDPFQE